MSELEVRNASDEKGAIGTECRLSDDCVLVDDGGHGWSFEDAENQARRVMP